MKLLVVEDEPKMVRLLERGLREEGHQVDVCTSGVVAVEQAEAVAYDVILLDWSLPEMDGLAVLRRWRERDLRTPVLLLTARGTVGERVTGLRAGADDYLVKPFDFEELVARLEALHRRAGGHDVERRLGPLLLDARRRTLSCGQEERTLTGREFALLSELWGHAGDVLTRSELLSTVWGTGFDGAPNVVDVYVGYLRTKLRELAGEAVLIQAVRGVGFRLVITEPKREGRR
ncbi:response regulator transcription factor [Chondromyces crocatus]|uniref:response regulator transcription factor n=1 Tax=Chondromyces crocatus TaxID=52 RepID=UPI0009EA0706|nr:response regulator transcription factor [Chondromyces crocatus]